MSCRSYRNLPSLCRRNFLKVGAVGSMGVSLSQALRAEAAGITPKAKSVILMWLQGGVSHHETFDPKPDAPADIRGEQHQIATSLPGIYFNEYLPKLARHANKLAVVRSLKHREGAHERGSMYMVEGRRPSPARGAGPSGNPQIGSIVAHELGPRGTLPAFFSIPGNDFTSRFVGHGWLPGAAGPYRGVDKESLRVGDESSLTRLRSRLDLRTRLGRTADQLRNPDWDTFDHRAIDIITSRQGADAFDVSQEPESIREMYGLVPKRRDDMATLTLTARRLVESGVRFVTIGRNSWDHHSNIFPQLKSRLPGVDDAFSALVLDLEQRGMLDDTLVVYMTEFGRTPKVNKDAGRDHWANACSVAFAGAGIQPGQVIGATDVNGGEVIDHPVSPEEIAATILHLVGIPPQKTYLRNDGRPIPYVETAQPIQSLLS